jgi:ribonuclease BN (tRNA processing enzyme)
LEVRLLGSGGWLTTDARETGCLAVHHDDRLLVIDAGSGLRRLVTQPMLADGVRRLDLLLTHFHLDHFAGLVGAPALASIPERVLWGAGRAIAGVPLTELLRRLLGPPFLLSSPEEVDGLFAEVHDVEPGAIPIPGLDVRTRLQPKHPTPTLAVRVGDEFVYCTDTAFDEDTADFVRGVPLLFHEAWEPADTFDHAGHTAAGDAARVAAAAGVERLVLIHVAPHLREPEELLAYARAVFPATELGVDGARYL